MVRYELIAIRPLYRQKRGLFRDMSRGGKLSFGKHPGKAENLALGHKTTAPSRKQAVELATKVLTSNLGVSSVLIRNLDNPKDSFRLELVNRKTRAK